MSPASASLLDYVAFLVFALTGAIAAARRGHDLVTFAFFAAITGVGGGTVRDLLIGAKVFWLSDPAYVGLSLVAALIVWLVGPTVRLYAVLLWLDAFGMAAYAVVGAAKALAAGVPWPVAVVLGLMTASFGGVIRDVLAGEPSVLLRREIYVSAAGAGALVFALAQQAPWLSPLAAPLGVATGFVIRAGAMLWGWRLPAFRQAALTRVTPRSGVDAST